MGVGHRRSPLQIRGIDVCRPEQQFDALVRHCSDRVELPGEAGAGRQRPEEEQIRNAAIVVRQLGGEPSSQKPGVSSEFPFTRALIAQSRIAEDHIVYESRTAGEGKLRVGDELGIRVENSRLASRPAKGAAQPKAIERAGSVVHCDI